MIGVTAPKVILIGGPPGAGKTTLGLALALRLRRSSVTVDTLTLAARAVTTPSSHPALHAMGPHTEYFTAGPPEKLIADAKGQSEALRIAVDRVVRAHSTFREPVVFDGWQLRPAWFAGLGLSNVATFWIHIDPAALEARERANTAFLEGSTDPERMFQNFMARSLWHNDLIRAEAEKHGLPVIHQDGTLSVDAMTDVVLSADA